MALPVYTEAKLAYLKETKTAIRDALVAQGQSVSDEDTFRIYADKVRAIQTAVELPSAEDNSF